MSTNVPAVELQSISKVFEAGAIETHALSDVSLRIERGEFVAVVGPSGGGKSTMLSILGLLDTPSSGKYLLNGRDAETLSANARATIRNREIGFVFQSFNLIGDLSVYENVELPLLYGGMPAAERNERVEAALRRVDMLHRTTHPPAQLSGGQQQRVAIARAICAEPTLLLADEPTGNLDTATGQHVIDMLFDVNRDRGTTLVLVTHDRELASRADIQVVMRDGRIIEHIEQRAPADSAHEVGV